VIFGGDENLAIRRLLQAGYEVWFAPAARAQHQMPASRTTLRYVRKHAFDSARSRVVGRLREDRETGRSSAGYLVSRWIGNVLKAAGFAGLAALSFVVLRPDAGRQNLVRAWRSCGYLYQIARSATGRV
jgi:hypothetical protein